MSLRPSKHVWGYMWHALLGFIAGPNSPNGGFNLLPAAHPPHPLICVTRDIAVVVKKVAQNLAVLAS